MPTHQSRGAAPEPRRTDARLNRDRLVEAAHEEFAASGPGASLNRIAQRAGVGPGTLYRHFPNRQALIAAVLTDRIERLTAQADLLIGSEGPDEALARWLGALLAHARLHHGMGSALMIEGAHGAGTDCRQVVLDAAERVLARARTHGSARPDLDAGDLVQLVVGIALATAHGSGADQPDRLLALVLDAAAARPDTSPTRPGSRRKRV
ncbi:TetR/AcrR family transcriptional regulator [Streptomyces sp. NPDC096136]|uniref:TetR/AcrR family transcriptional regulator n=1 Tax=Streptomyces sp. NPDC096136 TaxID=3366076 RepID=UPI0038182A62